MVYASVDDLEARWRTLTPAEKQRAEVLLEDAADLINDITKPVVELTPAQLRTRKTISCQMVKQAMAAGDGPALTQESITRGPFGSTSTFANPTGDLYLTKAQKQRLGVGRQRAGSVELAIGALE